MVHYVKLLPMQENVSIFLEDCITWEILFIDAPYFAIQKSLVYNALLYIIHYVLKFSICIAYFLFLH